MLPKYAKAICHNSVGDILVGASTGTAQFEGTPDTVREALVVTHPAFEGYACLRQHLQNCFAVIPLKGRIRARAFMKQRRCKQHLGKRILRNIFDGATAKRIDL
jgi:hypothetical protein